MTIMALRDRACKKVSIYRYFWQVKHKNCLWDIRKCVIFTFYNKNWLGCHGNQLNFCIKWNLTKGSFKVPMLSLFLGQSMNLDAKLNLCFNIFKFKCAFIHVYFISCWKMTQEVIFGYQGNQSYSSRKYHQQYKTSI